MTARLFASLVTVAIVAAVPQTAQAYVREVTNSGLAVAWSNPCVTMQVYLGSPPPVLTAAGYLAASVQAAAAWSYPTLAGTDIRLTVVASAQNSAGVGYDKNNVIVFRKDTWCRQPPPISDAGVPEPDCYPSAALAVTSVFKNGKTGEILDTDIEFNAVDYAWGDLVAQPGQATATTGDYQNALTHELGHVLGLDHNCYAKSDAQPRLNDNSGAPELDCYNNPSLPNSVAEATMYPSVQLNDTLRRDLSPDDQQGICDIYPHLHAVCPPRANEGGCGVLVAPSPDGSQTATLLTAGAMAIAALALLLRKRTRI